VFSELIISVYSSDLVTMISTHYIISVVVVFLKLTVSIRILAI